MKPDLKEIETKLIELSTIALNIFAKENQDKIFYGFGFDVDATYGQVLLCFNTEEDFKKTAQYYIEKWNYSDEDLKELKFNFGDWAYQGFNLDYYKEWSPWSKYAKQIENYVMNYDTDMTKKDEEQILKETEEFMNDFMETCTWALLKLEQSGVFERFKKEENFFIQVINHDEDPEVAHERFEKIKKEFLSLI